MEEQPEEDEEQNLGNNSEEEEQEEEEQEDAVILTQKLQDIVDNVYDAVIGSTFNRIFSLSSCIRVD